MSKADYPFLQSIIQANPIEIVNTTIPGFGITDTELRPRSQFRF